MRQASAVYEFGPFRLDVAERRLLRDNELVPLQPKAFALLEVLIERQGHLVSKEELLAILWPATAVEESNLTQNVYVLRKTLGQDASGRPYLETVPRHGYRFVAAAKKVPISGPVVPEPASGSVAARPSWLQSRRWMATAAITTIGLATMLAALWTTARTESASFESMHFTRLTGTGNAMEATISRDGHHVAYVESDGGRQSIQLKQMSSSGTTPLAESTEFEFRGLAFSRDDRFLYYSQAAHGSFTGSLHRVPTRGGTHTRIANDVYAAPARLASAPTFSPDGREIAFVRAGAGSRIIVASSEGGGAERELLTSTPPEQLAHVAWSPNGERIAYTIVRMDRTERFSLRVLSTGSRPSRTIALPEDWVFPRGLTWHPDGRALFLVARDRATRIDQVLQISFPDGRLTRVTNDVNSYVGVAMTADAGSLLTVQRELRASIWVNSLRGDSVPITPHGRSRDMVRSVAWTADNRILYQAEINGDENIWVIGADGANARQLTFGASDNVMPAATRDGRFVVFASNRNGRVSLWRMDFDGGNARQLSTEPGMWPETTSDSRWVLFSDGRSLRRVGIEGGESSLVRPDNGVYSRLSPNGRLVATFQPTPDGSPRIDIAQVDGGPVLHAIRLPTSALSLRLEPAMRWMADSRSILYVDTRGGVSNIWTASIDGGPHLQLTAFDRDFIQDFDLSEDGRRLVLARVAMLYDAMLIQRSP